MIRLLIVDDERTARKGLTFMLTPLVDVVDEAEDKESAEKLAARDEFDLALIDLRLPTEEEGLALVEALRQRSPLTPIMVMTAYGSVDSAVKAMKAGATDYVTKDFSRDEIIIKIGKLLETRRLWLANLRLSEQVKSLKGTYGYDRYDEIIGDSPVMRDILDLIARVAHDNDSTVLITGESGTGKELVARAVHQQSPERSSRDFVTVDVASIPANLLESQMFGHERGAFTHALQKHIGFLEMANGGTIFLDEIGDLSYELQVKLLRFLEERKFYRVGGTTSLHTDVRIIAATNRDLEDMVQNERFRKDLYYRLNVVRIHLPPLRERRPDIPLLVEHYRQLLCESKGRELSFPEAVMKRLQKYDWPGNVRELRNLVERLFVTAKSSTVTEEELQTFSETAEPQSDPNGGHLFELPLKEARNKVIENFEKRYLALQLKRAKGNITQMAKLVGESREGLSKKIKRYGLKSSQHPPKP